MTGGESSSTYRCGAPARWLPRVLGGSLLVVGLVTAYELDPTGTAYRSGWFRGVLALLGGAGAIWIVRKGAETRLVLRLAKDAIRFSYGGAESELRYERIVELAWANSFGASRSWLGALELVDHGGRRWRVPGLIDDGDRLVEELLDRCDSEALSAWAEARQIRARMGRASRILALGYGAAVSMLVLATALQFG